MWRSLVLVVLVVLVAVLACGSAKAPVEQRMAPPPVAVAEEPMPAMRLGRNFTPIRYTARLALDPAKPTFEGVIAIEGTLEQAAPVIWLHGKELVFSSAKASDGAHEVALTVTPKGELLEVRAAKPLDPGKWTLTFVYRGAVNSTGESGAFVTKYANEPYLVSQFESTAARTVFPCLDEPDRKATWQLTLDVPRGLITTSNTMPTDTKALDATHERIAFGVTRPISSYLVAFAVGPFEIIDAGKSPSGVPLRVVTLHDTRPQAAFIVSALPKIVGSLEAWFGMPYPYAKLDIVAVPEMLGAMENVGMITCAAQYLIFAKPSPRDLYAVVSTIGHETAHQWFGDLVTAKWWDDIWLNESFATFMEDKVLVAFDPKWPVEAITHRQRAFHADELVSARKIHQPIEAVGDINNAFDEITYPKGGTVLRMIEHQMGETAFQTAIQRYITAHADSNATSAELFAAIGDTGAFSTWFETAGVPEVAMDLTCDSVGKARLGLAQKRFLPDGTPSDQTWSIPVCIAFDGAKHERLEQCTLLDKPEGELELPVCPSWFAPAGDYGYYHARLDPKVLESIRDKAWTALTPDEHISIYNDVALYARAGSPPLTMLASLTRKLAKGTKAELAVALGDPFAVGSSNTRGFVPDVIDAMPKELVPAARAKLRPLVDSVARTYGLAARADEDQHTALVRADLLPSVIYTRSSVLDAEAKKLAPRADQLSSAQMQMVLTIAVNADPQLQPQLLKSFAAEHDLGKRQALLFALAGTRDLELHRATTEALFAEPSATPLELVRYLRSTDDNDLRGDNEAYLREHFDAIMKRLPADDEIFPLGTATIPVFTDACDPARRDEIAAYVTKQYAALPASARPIKQAIEAMDNCIARKKVLEPSLHAWLTSKP